jgi:hypothetical protein
VSSAVTLASLESSLVTAGVPRADASGLRDLVRRRHAPRAACDRLAGIQEEDMLFTRGSTLRSTLEFLEHALPPAARDAVLTRLAPEDRALVEHAAVTDDVPYRVALALWRSADVALAPIDPQWAEHAGAEAIRVRGMQLYSGLLRKPTPEEFLAQHISLFQRYYRPGDMKVAERAPGRATARLIGFEPGDRLFCRRLSGGWLAAITIAGGREPVVNHARCVMEGDLFCEWEVRWK